MASVSDDVRAIFKKLDTMNNALAEMAGDSKAQRMFCEERVKVVNKHERVLYGNGTEGLITSFAGIKTSVDGMQKNQAKSIKWLRGLVATMVLAGIGIASDAIGLLDRHDEPAATEHQHGTDGE